MSSLVRQRCEVCGKTTRLLDPDGAPIRIMCECSWKRRFARNRLLQGYEVDIVTGLCYTESSSTEDGDL